MKRTYDGLACKLRSGWRGVMWLEVQKRREEERKRPDTAATLMSRRFMSCWSAERKPWLILGKTIWAGVCEVKRCRRLKEDQVPEEGGGRQAGRGGREEGKCKRETDFVRIKVFTDPPAPDQDQHLQPRDGEIHTFHQRLGTFPTWLNVRMCKKSQLALRRSFIRLILAKRTTLSFRY